MHNLLRTYETVAASQTAQVLGNAGDKGDILETIVIVPETLSPGAIAIKDGTNSAITVFAGGANSLTELRPIVITLGAISQQGAWQITTGADVSVIARGQFS